MLAGWLDGTLRLINQRMIQVPFLVNTRKTGKLRSLDEFIHPAGYRSKCAWINFWKDVQTAVALIDGYMMGRGR